MVPVNEVYMGTLYASTDPVPFLGPCRSNLVLAPNHADLERLNVDLHGLGLQLRVSQA